MLHWQLIFHQFIRPKSLCQRLRAITRETIDCCWQRWWVLKLLRFIFQAPLLVLCSRRPRRVKTNRGRAGTSTSVCESNPSTEQGAHRKTTTFDELCCLHTKKTTTLKKNQFCSTAICSDGKFQSSTFEDSILIPTGSKSFWSRDWFAQDWLSQDWNNLWSRGTESRGTWFE